MNSRFGGRPRLPREAKRDQRIVTFLTGEERRRLEKIAGDLQVSVSKACHELISRGLYETDRGPQVGLSNRREGK